MGPKNYSFPTVKLTFVNVTLKNVIPVQVKLGALKACLLLLWVFLRKNYTFCTSYNVINA